MLPKWGVEWQTKGIARDEASAPAAHIRSNSLYVSNDTRSGKLLTQWVYIYAPRALCVWGFFIDVPLGEIAHI